MSRSIRNNLNELKEIANKQRKILEDIGRHSLGVEATNLAHSYEKIIKAIMKEKS